MLGAKPIAQEIFATVQGDVTNGMLRLMVECYALRNPDQFPGLKEFRTCSDEFTPKQFKVLRELRKLRHGGDVPFQIKGVRRVHLEENLRDLSVRADLPYTWMLQAQDSLYSENVKGLPEYNFTIWDAPYNKEGKVLYRLPTITFEENLPIEEQEARIVAIVQALLPDLPGLIAARAILAA